MLLIAVAVPTFDGGGFGAASRSAFVALAGMALLAAGTINPGAAVRVIRSPLLLTLLALAAVSLASATWTVGGVANSLRWGLVVGGYAAVLVSAAVLADETGPWPFAVAIGALAVVEAILGLHAVAFHELPDAERLARTWRPGGTYQYQPALAILEVGALPILQRGLASRHEIIAGAAASSLVLVGASLGLSGSRLGLALAVATMVVLAVHTRVEERGCAAALATFLLTITGMLLAPRIFGPGVAPDAPGVGTGGVVEVMAVSIAAGLGWLAARAAIGARRRRLTLALAGFAAVALTALAILATGPGSVAGSRGALAASHGARSDFLHGREHEWAAAIDTWFDRPLIGFGADAYSVASSRHQTIDSSLFAHDLPLELAAELGVLGLLLGLALYATSARSLLIANDRLAVLLLAPFITAFLLDNLVDWAWHLAGLGATWAAATGALIACSPRSCRLAAIAHERGIAEP